MAENFWELMNDVHIQYSGSSVKSTSRNRHCEASENNDKEKTMNEARAKVFPSKEQLSDLGRLSPQQQPDARRQWSDLCKWLIQDTC